MNADAVGASAPPTPLNAPAVHVAALRLRPEVALACGIAGAAAFVITALVAVPRWEAAGGTGAGLAGIAAVRLPGCIGPRIFAASFGTAAAVLVLGWWVV